MKLTIRLGLLGLLLAAAAGAAAQPGPAPQKPSPLTAGPQRFQVVLMKLGPAWRKGQPLVQQPGIQDHAAFVQKLVKEGMLVLGGPLIDEQSQVFTGSMMILAAATPEDARRTLEADPALTAQVFQVDRIETMIITGASWRPALPKK